MSRPLQATKTPGIYRRGKRYVVVLRDRTGRQFKRSTGTLAEARVLKSTLSADIARGELQVTERMTFERYAREWVETYSGRTSRGIRPQTLADYRRAIERRAIPFFGRMQLADVTARDIKRFAQELAAADLSANTNRLQLAPVKALLATAVEACAGRRYFGLRDISPVPLRDPREPLWCDYKVKHRVLACR